MSAGDGPARDMDGRGLERTEHSMILRNKKGQEIIVDVRCEELAWFETLESGRGVYTADVPERTCSYCGFEIPAGEAPVVIAHCRCETDFDGKDKEARLHRRCFGILEIKPC